MKHRPEPCRLDGNPMLQEALAKCLGISFSTSSGTRPESPLPVFRATSSGEWWKCCASPMVVCGVRQIFVERYPIWLRHVVCCSLRPGDRQQTWCEEVWRPNRHLTRLRLGFSRRSLLSPCEYSTCHMNQGGTVFGEIGIATLVHLAQPCLFGTIGSPEPSY